MEETYSREIEVKLALSPQEFNSIEERILRKIKAKFLGKRKEIDIYFLHPLRDFSESKEALRVRKTSDGKFFLTYKKIGKGPFKSRKELEVEVSDGNTLITILEALGFKKFLQIEKERKEYLTKENIKLCLDNVKDLGLFLEIEVMNSDPEKSKRKILDLIKNLGIKSNLITYSYLELFIKQSLISHDNL